MAADGLLLAGKPCKPGEDERGGCFGGLPLTRGPCEADVDVRGGWVVEGLPLAGDG